MLLVDRFLVYFAGYHLSCSVRRESLWNSRDLSIHPVSCSGMWKSCNKYLLFESKKEWTPDHQKWTKEPYLGGAFISTESQDCPTKICWCSEVHQPGQREWGETGQAQHKPLIPFLKEHNCLDLQRPQYPLKKERATHSSILAWRIPWSEEPGGLQSMGSQRVGHDWATKQQQWFTNYHKFQSRKQAVLPSSSPHSNLAASSWACARMADDGCC